MSESDQARTTTLRDAHPDFNAKVKIRLAISPNGVSLYAEGYGDRTSSEGFGSPLFVELHKGELRVLVWADINREDPTHISSLGGDREGCRQPDNDE
jgi:hypothetical protein